MKRIFLKFLIGLWVLCNLSGCIRVGREDIVIPSITNSKGQSLKVGVILDERPIKIGAQDKAGKWYVDEVPLSGFDVVAPEPKPD